MTNPVPRHKLRLFGASVTNAALYKLLIAVRLTPLGLSLLRQIKIRHPVFRFSPGVIYRRHDFSSLCFRGNRVSSNPEART